MTIHKLREHPALIDIAAPWFFERWGIPLEAYRESMEQCVQQKTGVPQWYLVLDEAGAIAAGAGVIENDFHERKDLSPNLCALFVEKEHRKRGLAKQVLDFARKDFGAMGFQELYLLTDHIGFYEKCGWAFYANVPDDEGKLSRMYVAPTL